MKLDRTKTGPITEPFRTAIHVGVVVRDLEQTMLIDGGMSTGATRAMVKK
ncbi:MAG: hypothetical protein O2960_27475 [Verrucomicrobia bacterium]|nr:hypothetical protein [Verrucomicrobiota bacterium]